MGPTPRTGSARARVASLLVAVVTAVLALTTLGPAAADPDIDGKLSAASDDLADASKAVQDAAAALERARTQLPAAQAEVAAAKRAQAAAEATEAAAAKLSARAAAGAILAEQRVADAKARIVDMDGQIGDLARAVYTQGPYAELAAILSAATPSDFADRLEAVRSVSRSQNRALSDLQTARADLALASIAAQQALDKADRKRREAAVAVEGAAAATTRARTAKARVDALISARARAVATAAKEKATVLAQYEALKVERRRLQALERRAGGFSGVPTGNLIWPIPGGALVQRVGPRIHPVYGYRSCHTGIDIRGSYGTTILSPAAGKVILVASGGPFGLHTLISHGGGVTTMTAHQSSVAVRVGQIVSQGQAIGYVGSSGWVTGPHLHWEVHVDGVPFDPLGWFGGSRTAVAC